MTLHGTRRGSKMHIKKATRKHMHGTRLPTAAKHDPWQHKAQGKM